MTPQDKIQAALICIKSAIAPLSQINDNYKQDRETAMHQQVNKALSALAELAEENCLSLSD